MNRDRISRWFLATESSLVYFFLYAPIAILIIFSFNSSRFALWEGFTWDWYKILARDQLILRAIRNSLIVAFAATTVSVIIGTLAALGMQRFQFKGKKAIDGL
ncbi:MAG TPA: spermidine/putrescine ABC transporter permease PotC, partial [Acidobacteriota bacterium]|nr:spermidine/putrescine ABC transporter permease PotC [Acidobacteriota bacterium]